VDDETIVKLDSDLTGQVAAHRARSGWLTTWLMQLGTTFNATRFLHVSPNA
jgi:protein-arginine kinase